MQNNAQKMFELGCLKTEMLFSFDPMAQPQPQFAVMFPDGGICVMFVDWSSPEDKARVRCQVSEYMRESEALAYVFICESFEAKIDKTDPEIDLYLSGKKEARLHPSARDIIFITAEDTDGNVVSRHYVLKGKEGEPRTLCVMDPDLRNKPGESTVRGLMTGLLKSVH